MFQITDDEGAFDDVVAKYQLDQRQFVVSSNGQIKSRSLAASFTAAEGGYLARIVLAQHDGTDALVITPDVLIGTAVDWMLPRSPI